MADHDVVINPKYGIDLGSDAQVDTDLSYALGTTAQAGLKPEPDPDYTAALPRPPHLSRLTRPDREAHRGSTDVR